MSDTPETDALCKRLEPLLEGLTIENAQESLTQITRETLYHAEKLERERDEARKLLQTSKSARKSLNDALDKTLKENRELRAEIERLKADKARLDWRINHCAENVGDLVAIRFATSASDAEIEAAMKGAE